MRSIAVVRGIAALAAVAISLGASATEFPDTLTTGVSPVFDRYNYSAYWLTPAPETQFRVIMKAKTLDDPHLLAVAPDGSILHNDDHGLPNMPGLKGSDAAIVVDRPMSGRWLIVATSHRAGSQGDFTIEYPDSSRLEAMPRGAEPPPSVAIAFAARGVQDPIMRRDALYEQLTLASFRTDLRRRLQAEITQLEKTGTDASTLLDTIVARQRLLAESGAALKSAGPSKEILAELVKKEEERLASDSKRLNETLLIAGRDRIALSKALAELDLVNTISNEIKDKEDGLMREQSASVQNDLRSTIVQLRADREAMGKALAEKLLNSRVVTEGRFNVSLSTGDLGLGFVHGAAASVRGSVRLLSGRAAGAGPGPDRIDPQVWLPAMLPWPPPTPSSRMVLDRKVLSREGRNGLRTLGELDDVMRAALSGAGYTDASYWGVPKGFAMVTPLEQTNASGRPLATPSRWVTNIVEMKDFSLGEYLRALFTAPPGYFRVLVFVVSSEAFGASPTRELLATLERWSAGGLNFLPESVRAESFADGHRVTVLVYEFLKLLNTDTPVTSYPGRLKVPDHLKATKLTALLQ